MNTTEYLIRINIQTNNREDIMKNIILFFVFILLFSSSSIAALTTVDGGTVAGVWTTENEPYYITGSIYIDESNILEIEPGVHIYFNENTSLEVNGCLRAIGNSTNNIYFGPNGDYYWGGISINGMDWSQDSTIFRYCEISHSGNSAIRLSSATRVLVEKCTIRENRGTGGAGIYGYDSSPIIKGSVFSHNVASGFGGAIMIQENATPLLINNIIEYNTAENNAGGGLCFLNSSPLLYNNTIQYNNSLASAGGGIYVHNSIIHSTNDRITNNIAYDYGGGFCCWSGSAPVIVNSLISNNQAEYGGGFFCYLASIPKLIQADICYNTASYGGGVYLSDNTDTEFINSILWGNEAINGGQVCLAGEFTHLYATSCDIQDGVESIGLEEGANVPAGHISNCIVDNPLFASSALYAGTTCITNTSDWLLLANSPCIDTGARGDFEIYMPMYDLLGNTRLLNASYDLGPIESNRYNSTP